MAADPAARLRPIRDDYIEGWGGQLLTKPAIHVSSHKERHVTAGENMERLGLKHEAHPAVVRAAAAVCMDDGSKLGEQIYGALNHAPR